MLQKKKSNTVITAVF